jgi:hypothetical protein
MPHPVSERLRGQADKFLLVIFGATATNRQCHFKTRHSFFVEVTTFIIPTFVDIRLREAEVASGIEDGSLSDRRDSLAAVWATPDFATGFPLIPVRLGDWDGSAAHFAEPVRLRGQTACDDIGGDAPANVLGMMRRDRLTPARDQSKPTAHLTNFCAHDAVSLSGTRKAKTAFLIR